MDQTFEASRDATLAALNELAQTDPRIEALWLQGSLATGQADPFSDIDAYLAVRDAAFDELWGERRAFLERLGGVRLDLFFEKASTAPGMARPVAKPLVDKSGLALRFNLAWRPPAPAIGRI